MYKWARALTSKQILSQSSWKYVVNKQLGDYTYVFKYGYYSGKKYIKISGGYPGYMSEFVYYPDEDITIILLNNYGNYNDSLWPVAMGLTNIVRKQPYDIWVLRREINLSKQVLSQYTGSYGGKNYAVRFFVKEGKLMCNLPNAGEFSLLAQSESEYFFKNFTTQFRIAKDSNGKVEKLFIHEHGKQYELLKIE